MKRWPTLLLLVTGVAVGQDQAVPLAYSEDHYASTWSRNPFQTQSVWCPVALPGFGEDWELKGLTRDRGQTEALLSNKKTQETRWVKTTQDKDGFKLVKAEIKRDMLKSSVEVAKAGEPAPATFTFPEGTAKPASVVIPHAKTRISSK